MVTTWKPRGNIVKQGHWAGCRMSTGMLNDAQREDAWEVALRLHRDRVPERKCRQRVKESGADRSPTTVRRYLRALLLAEAYGVSGRVDDQTWRQIEQDERATSMDGLSRNLVEEAGSRLAARPPLPPSSGSATPDACVHGALRLRHAEALMELAAGVRSFIRDPRQREGEEPYISQRSGGEGHGVYLAIAWADWSLSPVTWLRLSVPDMRAKWQGDWGDGFLSLRQHLRTTFRHDLATLWWQARSLAQDQRRAAERLAARGGEFAEVWARIGRLPHPLPPRAPRFGVDPPRWAEPPYEAGDAALVRHFLEEEVPDLYARHRALAHGLYGLRDQLAPERVGTVIASTKCDICRSW